MNKTDGAAFGAASQAQTNATRPRMTRLLGATAGPDEGNVRALLALLAMLFLHGLFALLLVGYMRGDASSLKDFVIGTGAGLVTLDTGAVGFYFGKRSGEGA